MVYILADYLDILLVLYFLIEFVDVSQTDNRVGLDQMLHKFFILVGGNVSHSRTLSFKSV